MSTAKDRERRDAAFDRQKGLCYYCSRPMQRRVNAYGNVKPDTCTLEHLDDRYSPLRGSYLPGARRVVAACWSCNNRRAKERNAQFVALVKTGQPMPDGPLTAPAEPEQPGQG